MASFGEYVAPKGSADKGTYVAPVKGNLDQLKAYAPYLTEEDIKKMLIAKSMAGATEMPKEMTFLPPPTRLPPPSPADIKALVQQGSPEALTKAVQQIMGGEIGGLAAQGIGGLMRRIRGDKTIPFSAYNVSGSNEKQFIPSEGM